MRLKHHELKAATIRDLIRLQAARYGSKPCVVMDGESFTYAEAELCANRIANSLKQRGIGKGDVVAFYMHNSLDNVRLWLGCAKIGAIAAPLNTALRNVDLVYTITHSGARMIVVDDDLLELYQEVRPQLTQLDLIEVVRGGGTLPSGMHPFADFMQGRAEEPEAMLGWADPVSMLFTGGTTGMPKGVLVSNGWYMAGCCRYQEMFSPTDEDVHIGVGQMFHAIGSGIDVLPPLYFGMTTVMTRWFSASRFWPTARQFNATISVVIGPLLLILLNQPEKPDDGDNPLRICATATGSLPPGKSESFKERFGVDLLELYAQTETGALGSVSQRVDDRPYHSVGKPNGWCEVMVARPDGFECDVDEVGEILMRPTFPSTFMIGYYNDAAKTVEAWRDLWFHTGDLGHKDENGYLHFDGRMNHSIRYRGENVSAVEIEKVVLTHPAVEGCAAFGLPSELVDQEIKIAVKVRAGSSVTPLELAEHCAAKMAYFKVPRYIELVDSFPVTPTKGEVEKHKLRDLGIGNAWDRVAAGFELRRR